MDHENKETLTLQRAQLITHLAGPLPVEDRVRLQGALSIINAKIKALNTLQAAQLKVVADQRRAAGRAEARANAARALAKPHGGPLPTATAASEEDGDSNPSDAIDAWIDSVLLRHDVPFTRSPANKLVLEAPQKWQDLLEMLITGLYAASHDQALPELPTIAPRATAPSSKRATKPKKT